jgi:hypothetical protein
MLLITGAAQAVNVAVNGGFETGDFTGWTQFATGPNQTVNANNPPSDPSSSGDFHAQINNTVLASNSLFKQANVGIGQAAPGQAWTVTFDARGSVGVGGVAFAEFFNELSGGGTSPCTGCGILGGAPLQAQGLNPDPLVWTTFTFSGVNGADVSGGVTLQLGATTGGAPGSFANMFYDNIVIDVTPIPVPAAVWLFGSAIGLLGLMRRKAS